MITDEETNAVIVSDQLQKNFKHFSNELTEILLNGGILVKQVNNTADICCRDYLPLQINDEKFVQFIYQPSYTEKHSHLRTDPHKLKLPFLRTGSNLVLDGGNVVGCKNKAIVTDMVFMNNPGKSQADVKNMLIGQLAVEELIIIPHLPFDMFGQAGGMIRFLDEHTILVNNYTTGSKSFQDKLYAVLRSSRLEIVKFPYYDSDEKNIYGRFSSKGRYINYLHTGDTIIVPVFNHHYDEVAYKIIENLFPAKNLYSINANDIAGQGGMFCVCWNFKY